MGRFLPGLALVPGILVAALIAAPAVHAGELRGEVVTAEGRPIGGAIVTLSDAAGYSESVYSGMDGKWRLPTGQQGTLSLRARAPLFADSTEEITLPADAKPRRFTLRPLESIADISGQFTASAHAATLRWDDPRIRQDFVSQCQFCHQMGNEWTRKQRDEKTWGDIITRMQGYGSLITWDDEEIFRKTLLNGFGGKPIETIQRHDMHPDLALAKVREWAFGGGLNYVHDIELGDDGRLYGVDMSTDKVWILDPRTNAVEEADLPPGNVPLGGMFSGGVAPLGTFEAHHGPHSIVKGPDGKMYLTCSLGGEIAVFDPATRKTKFLPVGQDGIYPHTLRFDSHGILWFTLALSNQIGRLDPKTDKIEIIDTPPNGFWRWVSDAMLPGILEVSSWFGKKDLYIKLSHHKTSGEGYRVLNLPYGIDISPVDGSIWYSKLYSDFIGRMDPQTHEVREFPAPRKGPRRLRFDAAGNLWIPSFSEGYLLKFNTKSEKFEKEYRLPTLAENEYETPYALAVHPQTQQIWISANLSDRTLRFDPVKEEFVSYPSPTRVNFPRDFIFLPDGTVCSSNSNLPALAIEGQRPKIFCIEPDSLAGAK